MTSPAPSLPDLLAGWLPEQRWFAGKGHAVDAIRLESTAVLSESPGLRVLDVIAAAVSGDEVVRYQVPLALRQEGVEGLEWARVGDSSDGTVYDGLADPEASAVWLRSISAEADRNGVVFRRRSPFDCDGRGRVVGAEQSNTSVVFGDACILKVFRRLAPGLNPDLEVTRALADAGSRHVAEPYGWVEGDVGGERTTLGFLQRFLRNGTDGWKLATTSVRDLFAEGDLHADEVGGDFAGEAERLGVATAEVHATLREVLPSREAGPEESRRTAALMHERLDRAVGQVPELGPHADGLRSSYDAVAEITDPVPVQRVHGDFHLGQCLRTQDGWTLLDFEGEPARPLAERTVLMSPLRDVAGMLRSLDYAARSLLAERAGEGGLAYRAAEWAERNRGAFCDGYAAGSGTDPREETVLLRAFELDKAVYEVVYEARHRPSWLPIPLGSIERLAASSDARPGQ